MVIDTMKSNINQLDAKQQELAEVMNMSTIEQTNLKEDIFNTIDADLATEEFVQENSLKILENKEKTDQAKLKEIQQEINEIYTLLIGKKGRFQKGSTIVDTQFAYGDVGATIKTSVIVGGKEKFVFEYSSHMYPEDQGLIYPLNVVMKVGNEMIYYNGSMDGTAGVYKNHESLSSVKKYKKIITDILQ